MLSRIRSAPPGPDTRLRSRSRPGLPSGLTSRLRSRAAALLVMLCTTTAAVAMPARAVEMEGIRFDDAARVGGKELQLNGAALRAGFLTKGYVAALYLQEKARNATVVLGTPGAKRLQLRMLREAEPPAFARAIRQGIRDNHSEAQVQGLAARLVQFERTLGEVGNAHKGDVINLDFTPQAGTVVAINGTPRGRPIPGEDFYQAVLRVFLGDRPVDQDVKRGLLGG
ncbi:chalcone isomerase family protein [Cupriavidus oxalaticus]|uniref:Chalcone isomerase domain-containing protein n=2 Tax=Cupriavidus TaxID=106589 RepID=A0A4P7L9T0_9BURK|nr:chalcone isomerase family protein [Cupriavidus sp. IK-TO18]QBY52248.1 hypothetical protein E0W60_13590 [Cupriavidus oxalaticus]